jgi:hypothetical protein
MGKKTLKGHDATDVVDLSTRDSDSAQRLGAQLRFDTSSEMRRRRWIVGISLVGVTLAQIMTLKQVGILKSVPDLPDRAGGERVVTDGHAYKRLETPAAVLQIISYGATAALAAMGGSNRSRETPWLPLALLGKTAYDSFISVKQGQEALSRREGVSLYPALSMVGAFACLGLAAVDALSAGKSVGSRGAHAWPGLRDGVRERAGGVTERGSALWARGRELAGRGGGLFSRATH